MPSKQHGNGIQMAQNILRSASIILFLVVALLALIVPRPGFEPSDLPSAMLLICLFGGLAFLAGSILLSIVRNMTAMRQQRRRD
jgi:predicted membrane channel-forming protein YqfA (hemolysin III family)